MCIGMFTTTPLDPTDRDDILSILHVYKFVDVIMPAVPVIIHWGEICRIYIFPPFLRMPNLCDWAVRNLRIKMKMRSD
jgi:hypothetical protein